MAGGIVLPLRKPHLGFIVLSCNQMIYLMDYTPRDLVLRRRVFCGLPELSVVLRLRFVGPQLS